MTYESPVQVSNSSMENGRTPPSILRRLARYCVLSLLLVALVFIGINAWRRAIMRQETNWIISTTKDLAGLNEAIRCYESKVGKRPSSVIALRNSGCIFPTTSFVSSTGQVETLPLTTDGNWEPLDQILVRKELGTSNDDIVAVALPDKRFASKVYVLDAAGNILCITHEDWKASEADLRRRLGGGELWPKRKP